MFSTFYTTSSVELQGLISGSAETKEQAAEGLGELIDVTSEKTLREVVVPITGYDFSYICQNNYCVMVSSFL